LHTTCNAGKHIVRVSADQTDRTDDYDENYDKHDGIFRNVLTFLSRPKGIWASQHATVAPAFWRAHNGPVVLLAVGCKISKKKALHCGFKEAHAWIKLIAAQKAG
jgi:hypothetical protein